MSGKRVHDRVTSLLNHRPNWRDFSDQIRRASHVCYMQQEHLTVYYSAIGTELFRKLLVNVNCAWCFDVCSEVGD